MRTRIVLALLAAAALACSSRRRPDTEIEALLDGFDAAWRPERVGFEERALARITPLIERYPDDPRVMWRYARYLVAVGLAEPDPVAARDAFGRARAEASRCLELDLGFRRRQQAAGWQVALQTVDAQRQPCIDQLAWSWTRWWVAAGPKAMAIDETALDALTRRAQGEEGAWASALLAGCRREPEPGADPRLAALAGAQPWDLARVADRLACGQPPEAERDALRRRLDEVVSSDRARSRAARARVAAGEP